MTSPRRLLVLGLLLLLGAATPARADVTAFWGLSSSPTRPVRGFAFGVNMLVVGFELEYAFITEDPVVSAPSLRTGMINGIVQTPTLKTQVYLTAGGGFFQEKLGTVSETNLGTNIGGGLKVALIGPLKLRLDYRVIRLRGTPITATRQRFYAGANFSF